MTAFFVCTSAWLTARLDIRSDRGASTVEYALLAALVAVACIVALKTVNKGASSKFVSVNTDLNQ